MDYEVFIGVFSFTPCVLYVPAGSVSAYKSADQWKDFTNILPIGAQPADVTTTTGDAQGFEDVQGNNVQCTKIDHNGHIFILRGEKVYTVTGQEVK